MRPFFLRPTMHRKAASSPRSEDAHQPTASQDRRSSPHRHGEPGNRMQIGCQCKVIRLGAAGMLSCIETRTGCYLRANKSQTRQTVWPQQAGQPEKERVPWRKKNTVMQTSTGDKQKNQERNQRGGEREIRHQRRQHSDSEWRRKAENGAHCTASPSISKSGLEKRR